MDILAYFIIGGKRKMSTSFYIGAVIIFIYGDLEWSYQTQRQIGRIEST
jgi:hypothetical protein